MSLVVVYSKTGIEVQVPRIIRSLGDNIDYAADGIRAIQCRSCPFHDLHPLHVVQVEAVIIYIVQCLSRQAFAVYQEEDGVTAESLHVELHLLVHRVREFDAW